MTNIKTMSMQLADELMEFNNGYQKALDESADQPDVKLAVIANHGDLLLQSLPKIIATLHSIANQNQQNTQTEEILKNYVK